jgi:drug/metabolite transporter (DMT)-like permease
MSSEDAKTETQIDLVTEPFIAPKRRRVGIHPVLYVIPAFFDLFEHTFRNVSNSLIAPSVSQMLRSSVVVFAAILCIFFLKKRLYRHHFFSIFSIVLGLFFVGLS